MHNYGSFVKTGGGLFLTSRREAGKPDRYNFEAERDRLKPLECNERV